MSISADGFGARVLIVDDQDSNVRLLQYALRRAGYTAVETTTDPLEVGPMHRRNPYQLILLDLQMPRMNGFQVMEELSTFKEATVAVLVLSADPAQMVRALEAGASSFLSKPFVLATVLERVGMMLKQCAAPPPPPAAMAGRA
ncbi:MAG: response regulator [Acidobacteriota bacterium]